MLILAFLLLPAQLTADALSSPHAGSERVSRDIKVAAQPIKLVISEGCVQGDSASVDSASGKQLDLAPDSPLVLTHRIRLVPSSGLCGGCEADFEAFRQRLEGLEREVSTLRQTCAGAEGGCCTSQPSKGPGCTVHPQTCPDDCNDQGRCMDGKCVCFSGYTGEDCSISACPDNCSNKGKCVDGQCVCDPGFTGPVCSSKTCPDNCKNRGRCVNGQCVCNPGFTGPDCSTPACPDNCNNQGQCVNGKCVCDPGFTGPNCATAACPDNCSNRGRCVNGQCVCDPSFTGTDCSTSTCPDNCNNQGRCINGKCVCEPGFSGPDCSTAECPNNCNNWGRCVNGKCVCDVGFSGPDCSLKSCPNNCSNRGRCVRGKCVCRRGFTGPDCSECEEGLSGPDCDTALTGVTNLITKDITESTVTLSWTPPMVQYDTYYITFTSQKEGDQKITSTVGGQFSSYIQTGLAAGQEYHVSISGEKDGKRGAESIADFTTLISGPTNLQVVKTTTTSVIVQWERPQMEIERYHLKVSPTQGRHRGSQDMTLPPERDSAQIDGLEPGVVYDVTLVAEKDGSHSMPATVQVIPGPEPPSNLLFSDITDTTASVSWTRPRSPVTGFKVTYSHTVEGEPVSIVVDSKNSRINLSKLTPGSSYDVTVISLKDLDESDAITDVAHTLPDPPTDLRAINVTDTKALLLWRPALAAIDHYVIVYRSGKEPDMTITVSGNAAEQQLTKLHGSTEYMVTVTSQLGSRMSSGSKTIFTTTSGFIGGEGPRELTARQVTPRSAMLSWKPPPLPVSSYKLTYQAEGHEIKEVNPDPTTSEYRLTRLRPGSKYTVRLQAERGGLYIESISTEFITGNLRFPFPTDCSQELLNGMQISGEAEIFPLGQNAAPVMVYCDMETDGGGWTVFQRRLDGKVNFFKLWKEYRDGFGDVNKEFWLGNELIHNLTRLIPMSLRVDLRAGSESVYAKYSSFSIGPQKLYTLRVSGYSGTSGDSLTYHNGRAFSTRDRDRSDIRFCAMSYRGGWWYRNCHEANLNGLYDTPSSHQGVIWTAWKGKDFSIPFTEMKMRPASFRPPAQG
ncbi:tenascin-like isoform X3 [Denticeps clupeoides]|uniref:tenascin-like isoform X3 n=1 Tax=Denticeps clupeoides TaxID=299321 RepID=UPI0010A4C528|nr:tenascin-like isoform X3 [Denticeps clupeoides]